MSHTVRFQGSFAAGELDPLLAGRIELRAQQEGAARLRNVFPLATGGLVRRPGLAHVAEVPGARRIAALPAAGGDHLAVLAADRIELFQEGVPVATLAASVWTDDQLDQLSWSVWGESLLLCHPEVEPRRLFRDESGSWRLESWEFARRDPANWLSAPLMPYARFAPEEVRIELRNVQPDPGDPDLFLCEIAASQAVFDVGHVGLWLKVAGRYVRITNVQAPALAEGASYDDITAVGVTLDWQEQAFSPLRGWPATVTVHQHRLVLGGSRDLPDHLWLSRTGRPFDFDVGTGLDDEAIAFRLVGDQRHEIRALHAGRRLVVFTTAGEWVVAGRPLTPTNIRVDLQTRIGSPKDRRPRPAEVDGAVVFASAHEGEVREFVYVDSAQAWQAADIALLARHLVPRPRDLVFDGERRQLFVLREDGALASCTLDRNSNVVAWALQTTRGAVRALERAGRTVWLLVERSGSVGLERFDDRIQLDRSERRSQPSPTTTFSGLGAFVGERVGLIADGRFVGFVTLASDTVVLAEPARELVVGLPYAHEVEPLSVFAGSSGIAPDARFRPIRIVFRLAEASALVCDLGRGAVEVALSEVPFRGDVALRALGWRRGGTAPVWRIVQDHPSPFVLLAATVELKVNR